MESLPPEILKMIFDIFEAQLCYPDAHAFRDLKNIRLTCKSFCDIATPSLFKEHYVGLFDASLDSFIKLSQHPDISRYVKELCFVGDCLPEYDDKAEWEDEVDLRPRRWDFLSKYIDERLPHLPAWETMKQAYEDNIPISHQEYDDLIKEGQDVWESLPKHELTPEELQHHWNKYNEHRKQQESWGPAQEQAFVTAFSRLPNVCDVRNNISSLCSDGSEPPLPSVRREILVFDSDYSNDEHWEEKDVHMKHAKCLLRAMEHRAQNMKQGYTHIKSLKLENLGEQAFGGLTPPEVGPQMSAQLKTPLTFDSFEHLTSLDLDLSHCCPDPDTAIEPDGNGEMLKARGERLVEEVKTMLTKATNMVDLRLRLCPSSPIQLSDSERDMLAKLGPLKFPRLEKLQLSVTINKSTLLAFLGRHSDTLRDLQLEFCNLIGDNPCWESVLARIPELLQLDKIHLEELTEDDNPPIFGFTEEKFQKLVESWVLNGGKMDPPMTGEDLLLKYGPLPSIEVLANMIEGTWPTGHPADAHFGHFDDDEDEDDEDDEDESETNSEDDGEEDDSEEDDDDEVEIHPNQAS